jgi:phytol kinase
MTAMMGAIDAVRANQWLGVAAVMGGGLVLLSAMRPWQYFTGPHPEVSRKAAHIAAHLTALSFPWLFTDLWPVYLICGICITGFVLFRFSRFCFNLLGAVIESVQRDSFGGILGIVGLGMVFTVFRHSPLIYSVPVLMAGLADSAAALVGVNFGRHRYRIGKHTKSLEGSSAFFVVGFFCTAVPLAVWSPAGIIPAVLAGVALAAFVGAVEASAVGGLDNLLIPVFGCPGLAFLMGLPNDQLGRVTVAATFFFMLLLAWHLSRGRKRGR